MNTLMNLIALYNHLPIDSTYRSVIKEILNHLESMADATIFDVAEITASSRTTIWRMIKMLGYDSYSEFHHELKKSSLNILIITGAFLFQKNQTVKKNKATLILGSLSNNRYGSYADYSLLVNFTESNIYYKREESVYLILPALSFLFFLLFYFFHILFHFFARSF